MAAAALLFLGVSAASSGASELRGARARFELTALADPELDPGLQHAADDFDRSAGLLGNPVLTPARYLPVIGRQLRSAHALADSGSTVLDRLLVMRAELLDRTDDGLPDGLARVEFLTWLREEFAAVEADLVAVDLGPSEALVAPLDDARRTVEENLSLVIGAVADGRQATDTALSVFGDSSRYLVIAANNAEMRVGSGMFLSLGELRVDAGRLEVSDFEPTDELTLEGRVAAPPEVETLWGWADPGREWRNLALTPDFRVNGSMAAQMWTELGRDPVDGVLMVDVRALALLLEATGPVTGPDGDLIDADNVEQLLLHDQYLDVDGRDSNEARREQLADVAKAVLAELDRPGLDLGALANALQGAQQGRSLLAWSADETQQAGWETLNIDGAVDPGDALIGVANVDASKMDPFLRVTTAVRSVEIDDETSEVTFEVTVANRTPDGEPLYVLGGDESATYDGIVVAYLPDWASIVRVDGGEIVASGREDGNLVLGAALAVPGGKGRRVEIVVQGPTSAWASVRVLAGARPTATRWTIEGQRDFTDRRDRTVDLHGS